jgi:class 3 adenylate cyclase/tetratricopeptide (TPR) repeat protein
MAHEKNKPDKKNKRSRSTHQLPDLAKLFDELDSERSSKRDKRETPNIQPIAKLKRSPDLSALLTEDSGIEEEGKMPTYPDGIEEYLSPALLRKLNVAKPSRGVLINALDRLRSIMHLIASYLPKNLVDEKMRRPVAGLVSGKNLKGTLFFSDVSGFTALSEHLQTLGPEGAERMTDEMNKYFSRMLEILSWSGGILIKFAGDAMLAFFPEQRDGRQANWAVRSGFRMLRAMGEFSNIQTPSGPINLKMKIGIATGQFLGASVGFVDRMEYIVLGDSVSQTMTAEEAASGPGEIIVNDETVPLLDSNFSASEKKPGYHLVTQRKEETLDDFEIKVERRRGRSSVPLNASPHALVGQMEVAIRKIKSLTPFLAPELVNKIVAHASQRQFESEFRPTTTMFCNFTGPEILYTLWQGKGTSRLTSLLNAYFNAMQEVIKRYGGIISRIDPYSKGTKMLILFGAPVSHVDDPQRALNAALAMDIALKNLNKRWKEKLQRYLPANYNDLIKHRIGVTSGNTFAGQVGSTSRREYTVMGDDVNLSARLMGIAEMGQILVSDHVYQDATDHFVFTKLPPIRVKGKSQPIPIFQVDGPHDNTLLNRINGRGPLFGRQKEIKIAETTLSEAFAGSCKTLVISGPSGIGKSHFADMLARKALTSGAKILAYQCQSYLGNIPYAGWSAILRSQAGITIGDSPQRQYEKLHRVTTDLEIPELHFNKLSELLGISYVPEESLRDTKESRPSSTLESDTITLLTEVSLGKGRRREGSTLDILDRLDTTADETGVFWQPIDRYIGMDEHKQFFTSIQFFIESLLSKSPLVIYFEDSQWLDNKSQEVLDFISTELESNPILIILTESGDTKTKSGKIVALKLGPLDSLGTNEFTAHILVTEIANLIYEQSMGNPLYIREMARWLQRTYKISPQELRKVLQSSDALKEIVLSGTETLPEVARNVLRMASIIGNDFQYSQLNTLLPDSVDSVTLSGHLRDLIDLGYISLVQSGVDAHYSFQQSTVRDVLYDSLPFEMRRSLHTKLAQYLSMPSSERRKIQDRISAFLETDKIQNPAKDSEIIAHHFEKAEDWLSAARKHVEAGTHSLKARSHQTAQNYFTHALSNLSKIRDQEMQENILAISVKAHIGQGDGYMLEEDFGAAISSYRKAQSSIPQDKFEKEYFEVQRKLALALPTQGNPKQAEKTLLEMLEKFQPEESLDILMTLCWILWREKKDSLGMYLTQAQNLFREGASKKENQFSALLHDFSNDFETSRELYDQMGNCTGFGLASIRLGDQFLESNLIDKANELYAEAEVAWRSTNDNGGLALTYYRQAEIYWRKNIKNIAEQKLSEALELLEPCSLQIRADSRSTIQEAQKILKTGHSPWPTWSWQYYDDTFRISQLFKLYIHLGEVHAQTIT